MSIQRRHITRRVIFVSFTKVGSVFLNLII